MYSKLDNFIHFLNELRAFLVDFWLLIVIILMDVVRKFSIMQLNLSRAKVMLVIQLIEFVSGAS